MPRPRRGRPFGRHDRGEGLGLVLEPHTQLLTGRGGASLGACAAAAGIILLRDPPITL
jgi:hypothetical protein